MTARPIENSYWVEPDKVLAGEYPLDRDAQCWKAKVQALVSAGVSAFIDLTEEAENLRPYADQVGTASYQRFPIRDVSTPASREEMVDILDAIDEHIDQGRTVYVHCLGGVGRTGTVIGCWLARHGPSGEAALNRLHELWAQCPKSASRASPETKAQEEFILRWEEPGNGI